MKQLLLIFLCFYGLNVGANVNPFIPLIQTNKSIEMDMALDKDDEMVLPNLNNPIYSLSITCDILFNNPNGFVRILLEDRQGKIYQIIECSSNTALGKVSVLNNYCEETNYLKGIIPEKIKFYIRHSKVSLHQINYYEAEPSTIVPDFLLEQIDSIRNQQCEQIANNICKYNCDNNIPWIADATYMAKLPYVTKKQLLSIEDDGTDITSIEYYSGGIIEIDDGDDNALQSIPTSSYIDSFDWRNRHGTNWMTPVKHQGNSGYCVAFAACSMLEAKTNLWFNSKYDLDLSEQDVVHNIARCNSNYTIDRIYNSGVYPSYALQTIINYGVIDEVAEPFIDLSLNNIPPRPTGNYMVGISSYTSITPSSSTINQIKHALIHNGPVMSGFNASNMNHEMALVGYHTIQIGDTLRPVKTTVDGGIFPALIATAGSQYIGQTYWMFKDNYGTEIDGRIDGYMNLCFHSYNNMNSVFYTTSPISCSILDDDDIVCSDNDGDGFYFWGIGPKPSTCPDWIPDVPDGDDSNYSVGPMDEYGHCLDLHSLLQDTIYIDNDTTLSEQCYIYRNIVVRNNASLSITNVVNHYSSVSISIQNHGKLIIDGGTLNNACIYCSDYGYIEIRNNGIVNLSQNHELILPVNSQLNLIQGEINNQ